MKKILRQGNLGLVAALAILPGLSGCNKTIDWLFDAPEKTESVQASAQTEATLETAVPMSVTPHATAPAAKAQEAAATTDSEIRNTLAAWRDAWASRDVAAYLAFYVPSFQGREVGPANWQASRKRIIEQAGKIELTLGEPHIVVNSLDQATVTFKQNYRSNIRSDKGTKQLVLRRNEGRWLIEQESFKASGR